MSKLLALATLCLVALLPLEAQAQSMPYGTKATFHQHHATLGNGLPDDRSGWVYSFPVKVHTAAHARRVNKAVNRHASRRTRRNAPHSRQKSAKRAPVPVCGHPVVHWVCVFTTGYDDRGYTASGLLAGYGRVAVDPSIFRLGTRFYIPGYGYAVAADTGGAVIGYRVDLWFATASQCYANTGWRMVEVLS